MVCALVGTIGRCKDFKISIAREVQYWCDHCPSKEMRTSSRNITLWVFSLLDQHLVDMVLMQISQVNMYEWRKIWTH